MIEVIDGAKIMACESYRPRCTCFGDSMSNIFSPLRRRAQNVLDVVETPASHVKDMKSIGILVMHWLPKQSSMMYFFKTMASILMGDLTFGVLCWLGI